MALNLEFCYTPDLHLGVSLRRPSDRLFLDFADLVFRSDPGPGIGPLAEGDLPGTYYRRVEVPADKLGGFPDGLYTAYLWDLGQTPARVVQVSPFWVQAGEDSYWPPEPPALPVVVNGGFEEPVLPPGTYTANAPTGWQFDAMARHSANNSDWTKYNPPAPEGNQVAVIRQTGSISQVVRGWPAGWYAIRIKAAQRPYPGLGHDFEVRIDDRSVARFKVMDKAYNDLVTLGFQVAAGDHTLSFVGLNSAGGDNSSFLDDVEILAVEGGPQ